jgi:rhodanese-related sulfurtransferase
MTDPLAPLSTPNPLGYRDLPLAAAHPHLGAVRLIDVREVDEWNGPLGHIAGAELVPLATVPAVAADWDRSAVYVVVCRSGARSGRAAAALAQAGFRNVYNLTGGMMGWSDAGLPVARR